MCGIGVFKRVDAEVARVNVSPGEPVGKVRCSPVVVKSW